jgi:hypothetical protein
MNNPAYGANPGIRAIQETVEADVWFSGHNFSGLVTASSGVKISSANTDATNTPDTTLIGGNVFGTNTTSSEQEIYDPTASDGSNVPWGILPKALNLLESNTPVDRGLVGLIQCGNIKSSQLPDAVDAAAWAMLVRQGILPDYRPIGAAGLVHPMGTFQTAVAKTLTADNNGQCWVNTKATVNTFTLPTIANGLSFEFFNMGAGGMIIQGNDNIVSVNGLVFDTLTFTTASKMIGAHCRVRAMWVLDAYKWVVENLEFGCTMVAAT